MEPNNVANIPFPKMRISIESYATRGSALGKVAIVTAHATGTYLDLYSASTIAFFPVAGETIPSVVIENSGDNLAEIFQSLRKNPGYFILSGIAHQKDYTQEISPDLGRKFGKEVNLEYISRVAEYSVITRCSTDDRIGSARILVDDNCLLVKMRAYTPVYIRPLNVGKCPWLRLIEEQDGISVYAADKDCDPFYELGTISFEDEEALLASYASRAEGE